MAPSAAPGPDQRMQLVDEEYDLTLRAFDLFQDRLESVFNSPRYLHLPASIPNQDDEPLISQRLGNVAGDNSLGQPFRLSPSCNSRFTYQHRVVLCTPRKDLDRPPDLVITTNHGIQLAFARQLSEIARVL